MNQIEQLTQGFPPVIELYKSIKMRGSYNEITVFIQICTNRKWVKSWIMRDLLNITKHITIHWVKFGLGGIFRNPSSLGRKVASCLFWVFGGCKQVKTGANMGGWHANTCGPLHIVGPFQIGLWGTFWTGKSGKWWEMSGWQVWEDGGDVWESSMKQGLPANTICIENG